MRIEENEEEEAAAAAAVVEAEAEEEEEEDFFDTRASWRTNKQDDFFAQTPAEAPAETPAEPAGGGFTSNGDNGGDNDGEDHRGQIPTVVRGCVQRVSTCRPTGRPTCLPALLAPLARGSSLASPHLSADSKSELQEPSSRS
jgi:hypothetical protein